MAVILIGCSLWQISEKDEPAPVERPAEARNAGRKDVPEHEAFSAPADPASRFLPTIAADPEPKSSPPPIPQLERSIAELERRFAGAREKQEQIDLLREIAGHNEAAAVHALARIFPLARDVEVKESVIASLGDINPDAAPAARLALLEAALRGPARNVRLTALGLLGESDEPRALAALRWAAQEGADKVLREAAAALVQAAEGEP